MKHLLYISALLFLSNFAFAQEAAEPTTPARQEFHSSHELIVGHGFMPTSERHTADNYRYNYDSKRSMGALFATYRFHFHRMVSLGLTAAYEHQKSDWYGGMLFSYNNYDPYTSSLYPPVYSSPAGKIQRSRYTIASEITFNYLTLGNGIVRFYSVLGLGYTYNYQTTSYPGSDKRYYSPDGNPIRFNGYASPLGIRFGRALGGFAELGTGYKGVMNYGLSYKF